MMISVIIAAYRSNTLDTAVESILCQVNPDWELFIVGQGEDERVREVANKWCYRDPRIKYLHIEKNGTCRARNAGILASSGQWIAFIDDDCEASPTWLSTIAEIVSRDSTLSLIGGSVECPPKTDSRLAVCPSLQPSECIYDSAKTPRHPPPGWNWIGCNVAFPREIFSLAGKFDEYLGPGTDFPAGEDTDYKLRLEDLGLRMASTPRAVVYHTYGYRYGLRCVLRNARNYAYGNSGLAGKLTLSGDKRGKEWMDDVKHECLYGCLHHIYRFPKYLYRLYNSQKAYKYCLHKYTVQNRLLVPR